MANASKVPHLCKHKYGNLYSFNLLIDTTGCVHQFLEDGLLGGFWTIEAGGEMKLSLAKGGRFARWAVRVGAVRLRIRGFKESIRFGLQENESNG